MRRRGRDRYRPAQARLAEQRKREADADAWAIFTGVADPSEVRQWRYVVKPVEGQPGFLALMTSESAGGL